MLELENTVSDMNNLFNGLISWLDMTEEKIFELENMLIDTSET